jgi:hypothetical protein
MIDDRSGIDRLRDAVDLVAATIGPPSVPRRHHRRRTVLLGSAAGLAVLIAATWWIGRDVSPRRTDTAPLGIEVRQLRLHGRDVDARVFDAAGAGTIVVAPRMQGGA